MDYTAEGKGKKVHPGIDKKKKKGKGRRAKGIQEKNMENIFVCFAFCCIFFARFWQEYLVVAVSYSLCFLFKKVITFHACPSAFLLLLFFSLFSLSYSFSLLWTCRTKTWCRVVVSLFLSVCVCARETQQLT